VGIFRAIVRSPILYVLDIGEYLRLGGRIAAKLVGDDGPRDVLQSLQQLAKEFLGSLFIAERLHQNIEHLAVLIDGAPQILRLAIDREIDFIEMPAISRARCPGPQPLGIGSAKLVRPIANGFVSHDNPAFGHHLFDISVAQAEAKIQPDAVADDLGREPATVIQGFR